MEYEKNRNSEIERRENRGAGISRANARPHGEGAPFAGGLGREAWEPGWRVEADGGGGVGEAGSGRGELPSGNEAGEAASQAIPRVGPVATFGPRVCLTFAGCASSPQR